MSAASATSVLGARRVASALGLALLVALPVLAARAWCGSYADALGDRIAFGLARALEPLSSALTPVAPDDTLTDSELSAEASTFRVAISAPSKSAAGVKRRPKANPPRAIRISAAQVLALAAHRAMPGAVPIRASADHPAGLQLRGVSALGVGLQDGDVLTEAAGQRAASVATVVGVVLAARARHSAEISGRFYRAGLPYVVTVEQPYPPGT